MLMPLRCNIMKVLIHSEKALTAAEIFDKVDNAYKREKQCTITAMDDHLMSMKGVGIVEATDASLDSNGNIVVRYAFTDYGLEAAKKYFPSLL